MFGACYVLFLFRAVAIAADAVAQAGGRSTDPAAASRSLPKLAVRQARS